MRTYIFVLLLSLSATANGRGGKFKSKSLPSYIKACKASDPKLGECVVAHGKETIPFLFKGEPNFQLPSLLPFKIDKVELKPSAQLTLVLKNVLLHGLETVELKNAAVDLKKKHISIQASAKTVKIVSDYKMDGQILILPITGEGPATINFDNVVLNYAFDFDLIKRDDGKEYMSNIRPTVDFKIGKTHLNFENLFNGNKELGDSTNKLLNENSGEVVKEFSAVISNIVGQIATQILSNLLTRVPYEQVFL